mgnify:FL=1
MAKQSKYTIRKYDGDDCYSWAVFRKADLPKGHRGIVFWTPTPLVCGLSRDQANYYKRKFENRSAQ